MLGASACTSPLVSFAGWSALHLLAGSIAANYGGSNGDRHMQVGFVGLGRMGAAMAANLLAAGHQVTVFNRSPGKARTLVDRGAVAEKGVFEVKFV